MLEELVHIIFACSLFANAAVFVPQAIRIFSKKDAGNLSILTFLGFNIMQFFTVLHGYFIKDYVLVLGFSLSLITCGIVTILIFTYRNKNKQNNLIKNSRND